MNRFLQALLTSLLLALLLLGVAETAHAQAQRTLAIRDGNVWIDHRLVPADELPPSLNLEGLEAHLTFVGDATVMIPINGIVYELSGDHLREVAELDTVVNGFDALPSNNLTVSFRGVAPRRTYPGMLQLYREITGPDVNAVSIMKQHAQAMQELGQEMDRLSFQSEMRRAQDLERLRQETARQVRIAQTLPQLQVQSYFADVQQQDQELYDLLMRELQMEQESQLLAQQIRSLTDGAVRQQRIRELNHRLETIFDLKQENRRREIRQLERNLDVLRRRLAEREAMRERLIDQRLNELIGVHPSLPH